MSVAFLCRTCGKRINRLNAKNLFADESNEILQKILLLTGLWLSDELSMPEQICAYCIVDLDHAIEFRERCIKVHKLLLLGNLKEKQSPRKTALVAIGNESKDSDDDPLADECDTHIKMEVGEEFESDSMDSAFACLQHTKLEPHTQISSRTAQESNSFHDQLKKVYMKKGQNRCNQEKSTTAAHHSRTALHYFCDECGHYSNDESHFKDHMKEHENKYIDVYFESTEDSDNKQSLPVVPDKQKSSRISKVSIKQENKQRNFSNVKRNKIRYNHEEGRTTPRLPGKRIRKLKNYFCDQCGRHFNDKANLNRHLQRHVGVKQFECEDCGYRDYSQHLINLHKRITHQGEKPYACKYCGERYANSMARLRHQRNHKEYLETEISPTVEVRPHVCKLCNKAFRAKNSLDKHAVVHTGEQPFWCEICDVHFNRKSSLGAHYRSKFHQNKATINLNQTGSDSN